MKWYRCFLGFLLVFFITIAVLYITSIYNEQRSTDDGILVYLDEVVQEEEKGEDLSVTGHRLC